MYLFLFIYLAENFPHVYKVHEKKKSVRHFLKASGLFLEIVDLPRLKDQDSLQDLSLLKIFLMSAVSWNIINSNISRRN